MTCSLTNISKEKCISMNEVIEVEVYILFVCFK